MMPGAPQLTADEAERGYNNRAAVADHAQWFARWAAMSAAAFASERVVRDLVQAFFVQDDFGWLDESRFRTFRDYLACFFRFNPALLDRHSAAPPEEQPGK